VRYGYILPGGTAPEQLALGEHAEACGWDGIFVWEAPYGVDAWSLLAALAVRTERIHLGTMLTPLPWRRPWKVASQAATVEQLAPGRTILTLGLGAVTDDLVSTGEVEALRERADVLDDGIDLMRALWAGERHYAGPALHYDVASSDQLELMRPTGGRVPIWVVAAWPRPKSMRRALRCEGVVPQFEGHADDPALAADVRRWLDERDGAALDLVAQGQTGASDPRAAAAAVTPWEDAGCTWWLETNWEMPHHGPSRMAEVRERLTAGPPRTT
jgi:alkanesulfonate monooxygenase SsuD/methylene tetrahydromethanopterin reductase-like flavin-dependent oxidoreductase (luciferase family)